MSPTVENIYLALTREFNDGETRAIISSGQAVVLHRLAIMSKDGDWIVREHPADLDFILTVLESRNARYRFGAPLDARWLAGGWSSHLEFMADGIRVRCDFFSRPPRLSDEQLAQLWATHSGQQIPFLEIEALLMVKQTQREKDYAVIGELARKLPPEVQVLHSRSARDLIAAASETPDLVRGLESQRPLLLHALLKNRDTLEEALDKERRQLMRADENRLAAFSAASATWRTVWPALQPSLTGMPLKKAHALILQAAEDELPFHP
ncbi:hypothetical protein [Haloferula sp.]|uniref:hypothetical protein n=1 Tax=Haloferula sp. TaxID=2497595 RepID=UPI003C729029